MENTNPFQWEMHLLAQEFNEREAKDAENPNYLAEQEMLRQHNCTVTELEDRKRRDKAILDADQESEIDLINKKYEQKSQELQDKYINQRDILEDELYKKSGKTYKSLQKLHSKNLLQSQDFERKANDILQRMAKSLKEENTIYVSKSIHDVPVVAAETPPASSASESTTPANQAERVIEDQYLVASPSEVQPLLQDQQMFQSKVTPSMNKLSAPTSSISKLVLRPSQENHLIKRQKTKDSLYVSANNNSTPSANHAFGARDSSGTHKPIQSLNRELDKAFGSHAMSMLSSSSLKFPSRDRTPTPLMSRHEPVQQEPTRQQEIVHLTPSQQEPLRRNSINSTPQSLPQVSYPDTIFPQNGSMSPILISKVRAHMKEDPVDNNSTHNGHVNFSPVFAQVSSRSHSLSKPLESAPQKLSFKDGLTHDRSNMKEEAQRSDFNDRRAILSKRKASDINIDGSSEDIPIIKAETQARMQSNREAVPGTQEPRRRATNPSRFSKNPDSIAPLSGRKTGVKKPVRRVTSAAASTSLEPIRSVAIDYKPSNAESQLSFDFISVEYMSYNPGFPTKCYPVSWIDNGTHNYRLQVMPAKKKILYPYYGLENLSLQYPKLIIDDSWILGGFFHKERSNNRAEIYRPISKKERKVVEEGNVVESARMRIKFTSGPQLDHFLKWYREMHPHAEMRPK